MKNKIIKEMLTSLNVKCEEKLKEYVDFCINNDQNSIIPSKTSHHHIMPNKLFPEYSDLKENPWNGTHLLYSDHYYAHWLITEAIDDYSMLFSFCAMHSKDFANKRLSKEDLIAAEDFQKKMEERSNKHKEFLNEIIVINGEEMKRSEFLSRKAAETMKGNIRELAESKRMETINKIIIIDGEETTIAKEKSKKGLLTKRQPIIINGIETTIEKEAARKSSETQTKNGPHYDIHHINGNIIDTNVPVRKVCAISQALPETTKENYLGKSLRSKITLNRHNRLHLIGYYVIRVK